MDVRLAKDGIGNHLESGVPPIRLVPTRQRILVAAADPDTRTPVACALRRGGYDVVEACTGVEAIDFFAPTVWTRRDSFNAIVADACMPDLTGLDLLVALRCSGFETPVILMTAFGDEESRIEARSLGATAVLDKPFPLDALRAALEKAIPSDHRPASERGWTAAGSPRDRGRRRSLAVARTHMACVATEGR